jgi:phosphatidylinositol glycan class V
MLSKDELLIIKVALITRLCTFALGFLTTLLVPDFDYSGRLILHETHNYGAIDSALKHLLIMFLRWDAIYFLDISENGYSLEQEHAFFPLLPLLVKAVVSIIPPFASSKLMHLLIGVVISNTCFVFAAVTLYRLTSLVLNNKTLARTAAILFCIQPCGIFMSSM